MIDQIRAVLEKWNYSKALALYQASGTNPSLAKLLSSGETLFFRKKLRTELDALLTKLSVQKAEIQKEIPPLGGTKGGSNLSETITRRNLAIRRQDFLRGQLQLLKPKNSPLTGGTKGGSGSDTYKLCREILDLDLELNECWKIIHYYNEHGELPPDEIQQIINKAVTWMDLVRILSNYKVNVSKARSGKLPADKLKFYEAVLHRTESMLNQPIAGGKPPLQGGAQRAGGDKPKEE